MLVYKHNPKTGKMEWALVSESKPGKVLQWYGANKPSPKAKAKTEKRVQFFKNLEHSKGGPGSLAAKVHNKSLLKK